MRIGRAARRPSLVELVGDCIAPCPDRYVTDAVDDSGTAGRQLHAVVRCGRCGRSTHWHLDD